MKKQIKIQTEIEQTPAEMVALIKSNGTGSCTAYSKKFKRELTYITTKGISWAIDPNGNEYFCVTIDNKPFFERTFSNE